MNHSHFDSSPSFSARIVPRPSDPESEHDECVAFALSALQQALSSEGPIPKRLYGLAFDTIRIHKILGIGWPATANTTRNQRGAAAGGQQPFQHSAEL